MMNKKPIELEEARKTAMEASGMAKMKSDEAEKSAKDAEETVMGIADIQSGGMAKMHAAAARTAADAALAAYNTARMESGKAAAAAEVAAAVTARIAAEAAKKMADAQAKMAADEAMKAKATAIMAVKVSSDGKTFSVGDVSIMTGSPQRTVTKNGITMVTGKVGDVKSAAHTQRAKVDYAAGPPVVRARPANEYQELVFGTRSESSDDAWRLSLADKYIGNRTVHVWRDRTASTGDLFSGQPVTTENPYGVVGSARILKAEGDFYRTGDGATASQLGAFDTNAKISGASIGGSVKAEPHIYYYMSNGKKWLRRVRERTSAGGATTYFYKPIEVVENVKNFPTAMPYEHINYGMWEPLGKKADANGMNTASGLGTAFVVALASGGGMTSDMPNFGSASWKGHWVGTLRAADNAGNGAIIPEEAGMTAMADFRKGSITVDLFRGGDTAPAATTHRLAQLSGTINGNDFSGTKVSLVTQPKGNLTVSQTGDLYTVKEFRGAFGGRRQ